MYLRVQFYFTGSTPRLQHRDKEHNDIWGGGSADFSDNLAKHKNNFWRQHAMFLKITESGIYTPLGFNHMNTRFSG
jgi:hypothetical protein